MYGVLKVWRLWCVHLNFTSKFFLTCNLVCFPSSSQRLARLHLLENTFLFIPLGFWVFVLRGGTQNAFSPGGASVETSCLLFSVPLYAWALNTRTPSWSCTPTLLYEWSKIETNLPGWENKSWKASQWSQSWL